MRGMENKIQSCIEIVQKAWTDQESVVGWVVVRQRSTATPMKLAALYLLAGLLSSRAAEFRAGAAQVAITPAVGTPLAGYYSLRPSDGVLDELYAKALVMECDGTKAAIVVCDLITMPRNVTKGARDLIEKQSGIPGDHVMIAATHTHTAPVLMRNAPRDDFDGGNSESSRTYTAELPMKIAKAVGEANAKLTPAAIHAGSARIENVAYNRRYWMQDGKVAWNPRKLDPGIVAPAGPHDPEIGMLTFDNLESNVQSLATFVNYAMHPDTVGGTKFSADYPGVIARALESVRPGVSVFANGCCGNLNHRNVWWIDPQKGPSEAARLGNAISGAVCNGLPQLRNVTALSVRARKQTVQLPLPEITEADRAEVRDMMPKVKEAKFMQQVKILRVLDVLERDGKPLDVEVQVIAMGDDVAFVALPGEIFVELGLAIKKASPFKHTMLIELANTAIGYIPNRPAYEEGNYEVVSARCAAGSGEMLVETAIKLLRELKP
jgi:neutral ceramidase